MSGIPDQASRARSASSGLGLAVGAALAVALGFGVFLGWHNLVLAVVIACEALAIHVVAWWQTGRTVLSLVGRQEALTEAVAIEPMDVTAGPAVDEQV